MLRVAIFGVGYVGLVTAACLADLGNRVVCYDADADKIDTLRRGAVPIYEPGLAEMIARNVSGGRLAFSDSSRAAVAEAEIIFIAVGTPQGPGGEADLLQVRSAVIEIAKHINTPAIVVNKSTVPVRTGDLVKSLLSEHAIDGSRVRFVSCPEFVREGCAISDFMNPDRIVIGADDAESADVMRLLYQPLNAPLIFTSVRTAEMIKHAANAFLATKITFANEIANLCESVGADVTDVMRGIGCDSRIGMEFLQPGPGFGGSCLPKDVAALVYAAESRGVPQRVLRAVLEANAAQVERCAQKIRARLPERCRLAQLGLAFKGNTDDTRESPALAVLQRLIALGYEMRVHDPAALKATEERFGTAAEYFADPYECVEGAAAVVVATDWNEYRNLDFEALGRAMAGRLIFDLRNLYDFAEAAAHGFAVVGVGRESEIAS
jgi:UDPglucose 6-dehydrogenase